MYKFVCWFMLGYGTHKHGVPIANEVARKLNAKRQEEARENVRRLREEAAADG